MDDLTAFEKQIGSELRREIGVAPSFDTEAIARSAIASTPLQGRSVITRLLSGPTTPPAEGGFSTFSALKLIAAAVIVALFGGFLLAGILATPNDGQLAPAAVTESPSLMTTGDLLSGMVTEEVQPGVFRIDHDGARDLSSTDNASVVAGQDGSIWLEHSGDLSRLGAMETHDWRLGEWGSGLWDFEIAHDGTVWAVITNEEGQALRSFDGETRTTHRAVEYFSGQNGDVEVAPDGLVWAALGDGTLGYLEADGSTWQTIETPTMRPATVATESLSATEVDDQWGLFGQDIWEFGFIATESDVWTPYFGGVSHYADGEWEHVPYGGPDTGALPDGVLWGVGPRVGGMVLYRHDETGWRQWSLEELGMVVGGWGLAPYAVASDGSFWAPSEERGDCQGVSRFDGRTSVRYLPGRCVDDIDIAADGSVWLLAHNDLYVITPEAVATIE